MVKKKNTVNPYYNRSTTAVFNHLSSTALKNFLETLKTRKARQTLGFKIATNMLLGGIAERKDISKMADILDNDLIESQIDDMIEGYQNAFKGVQVYNATCVTEKLLSDFYEINRARLRGDKFFKNTNLEAKEQITKFLNVYKNPVTGEYYSESLYRYTLPNPNIYVELANTDDLYMGVLLVGIKNTFWGYCLTYQPEGIEHLSCFTIDVDSSSGDELPKWEIVSIKDSLMGEYNKHTGSKMTEGNDEDTLLSFIVRPVTLIMEIFYRVNNEGKKVYNFYTEDTNERPHYINYKGGKCVLPNRPTYIILDKDIKDVRKYARKSDSKIEYSFSWIVRGHYRRLHNPESFGKDMFNRKIQGKTWVESYTKGDQNLPLKNTNYKIKMA